MPNPTIPAIAIYASENPLQTVSELCEEQEIAAIRQCAQKIASYAGEALHSFIHNGPEHFFKHLKEKFEFTYIQIKFIKPRYDESASNLFQDFFELLIMPDELYDLALKWKNTRVENVLGAMFFPVLLNLFSRSSDIKNFPKTVEELTDFLTIYNKVTDSAVDNVEDILLSHQLYMRYQIQLNEIGKTQLMKLLSAILKSFDVFLFPIRDDRESTENKNTIFKKIETELKLLFEHLIESKACYQTQATALAFFATFVSFYKDITYLEITIDVLDDILPCYQLFVRCDSQLPYYNETHIIKGIITILQFLNDSGFNQENIKSVFKNLETDYLIFDETRKFISPLLHEPNNHDKKKYFSKDFVLLLLCFDMQTQLKPEDVYNTYHNYDIGFYQKILQRIFNIDLSLTSSEYTQKRKDLFLNIDNITTLTKIKRRELTQLQSQLTQCEEELKQLTEALKQNQPQGLNEQQYSPRFHHHQNSKDSRRDGYRQSQRSEREQVPGRFSPN